MIERYSLPEMAKVWSQKNRFESMLEVEKAVARVQARLGLIPRRASQKIQALKKIDIERISEIEKTTKHDVIAFVTSLAEQIKDDGRYLHYGLTSSDVLDTAMSLQIRQAGELLTEKAEGLETALKRFVKQHRDTVCVGRTHGMHAEPTTLGFKFAGFLAELKRNQERLERAIKQACVVKLSGAVGTYSAQGFEIEAKVAGEFKMDVETVATQVISRDRYAEVFMALTILMSGLERMAVEIRHLQRTEVGELEEGFEKGQKGSSAMPHKRNPIGSENLVGLSRLVRAYAGASLENITLWHERDISHSSVERVIFPDAFILVDYALDRAAKIIKGLQVNKSKIQENMGLTKGQIFSSHVLLLLVEKGLSREEAYALVQKHSHHLGKTQNLKQSLQKDSELKKILTASELNKIFSGEKHKKCIQQVIARVM